MRTISVKLVETSTDSKDKMENNKLLKELQTELEKADIKSKKIKTNNLLDMLSFTFKGQKFVILDAKGNYHG